MYTDSLGASLALMIRTRVRFSAEGHRARSDISARIGPGRCMCHAKGTLPGTAGCVWAEAPSVREAHDSRKDRPCPGDASPCGSSRAGGAGSR